MTTKVFVSHSAKSQIDQVILEAFVRELIDAGLDPWVDRERIEVGDVWNENITVALHQCHGAVVLFSQRALQSDFVKYEVSCLVYRKRSQSGFGLYPVVIDATPVETVVQGFFGAIQFGDYQIGKLDEKKATIIQRLQALDPAATTPVSAIEGVVFGHFRKIVPEVLREVAQDLGWEVWEQVVIADAEALHFVRRLLSEPLEKQLLALNKIKHALPVDIEVVFNLIAPCWVDDEAARLLDSVRHEAPGKRCAIINGTQTNFTCEQFLKRARPIEDTGILGLLQANGSEERDSGRSGTNGSSVGSAVISAQVPVGRRGARDLVTQIRRALCQRLNLEPRTSLEETDDLIDQELQFDEGAGRPAVDVLKLTEHQLPVLEELAAHFKRVTFVALTGEKLPSLTPQLQARARIIQPMLRYEASAVRHNEQYAYDWWSRRKRLLGIPNP